MILLEKDILTQLEIWLKEKISKPLNNYNDSTYLFSSSYRKALADVLYLIEHLKLKIKETNNNYIKL